ncbi:MAG: hypothetical protein NT023_24840, partial [Armatimonadetes bacterium]|nr:hypothetical protein [Armatimonadota bacterium]
AISQVHDIPGDSMAKVTSSVTAEEMGTVERRNIVYDPADIATPATQDLSDILVIAGGNPFYPLPIRSGRVTVDIYSGHNTATIERIFLKQGRFESGDTLEVGVQLKPYRRPAFVQSLFFKVPANVPSGRYQLIVRGGAPTATRFGGFLLSGGGEPTTPPATIAQMVARLKEQNVNTDLVGKLILNSAAPSVEGEHLSQLPPHLSALMRSDRNSAVRLERDEIKTSLSLSVVVSGTQQMFVNIQKRVTQEAGGDSRILSPSNSGSDSPGSGSSGSIIRLGNPSSTGEDVSAPFDLSPREIPLYRLWLSAEQGLPARSAPQTPPPPATAAPAPTSVGGAVSTLPPATIAPAKPALPDRPVGKLAKIWRQTGRGFSAGRFQGVSLSANGELRPTASLTRLTSTNETYLWSLVSDKQGNLYAGTGNTGSLLAISLQGAHRTLAKLPAVAVQSLLYGVDGNLYAGTGPRGEVFRVSTSGKVTSLGKIAEKYVTALAQDSRGNLIIGASGSGTVYRLNAGSSSIVPYIKTGSDFITALTFDSKDNLYVGAGLEGTLYKVTPEGKSSIVYTSKEGTVLAVAVDDKGYLYIGTGPRGNLLGIAPDGTVSTLYDKATSYYTSLKMTPEGTLFAVTANSVYHVRPNALPDGSPLITTLDSPKDLDFLTVLPLSGGRVAIGTGNIGEVYLADKNQARSGTFESVIHDTRIESRWGSARWTEQTPKGTGITVFTRSGNVAEPDSTWSDWAQVQRESADSGKVTSPSARFLQYRVKLELGTGEQTPSLKELSISYVSRNQAPKVNFQSPIGGERWSGSQSLRWSAVDPDGDSLLFDTYYSANNGATWIPLPSGKMETASAIVSPTQGEVSLEELKAKLDRTVMPQTMRDLLLERARQKQGGSTAFAPPQPTKETNRTFDTTLLPDGVYLFKVVASDALGDPAERKQGIGVSEAVTLCNALPQLSGIKSTVLPTKAVRIEGLASQKLLVITAVQYRVDDGEWLPALSRDGLFDGYSESFTITTFPLPPGAHTVEVLAFNSANGKRSTKISVTVP